MIDNKITRLLDEWKENKHLPLSFTKESKIENSPFTDGEYLIILKISARLNYKNKSYEVSVVKFYNTFAQSNRDQLINTNGDINNVKKKIKEIEDIFLIKWDQTISDILLENQPYI